MSDYPIVLDIKNKQVVVIGGGEIAERKIKKLLSAHANIVVVSPAVTSRIATWAKNGYLQWKKREFLEHDIIDAVLVFAATNDRNVNAYVARVCSSSQLINIVDDHINSSFAVPATLKRGKLSISVSSSGASPILVKKIVDHLDGVYGNYYEDYVDFLYEARIRIKKEIQNPLKKRYLLEKIVEDPTFLQLTKKNKLVERQQLFNSFISQDQ